MNCKKCGGKTRFFLLANGMKPYFICRTGLTKFKKVGNELTRDSKIDICNTVHDNSGGMIPLGTTLYYKTNYRLDKRDWVFDVRTYKVE